MKITLPLPPNMANSRFHWRVKHNKRKAYFEACDWHLEQSMRRNMPTKRFEKSRLRVTIYCGGRMDVDNAFARAKWPVDWLVRRHFLKGDSEKHLVWEMPEQIVKRNQQHRIEFEITEAA